MELTELAKIVAPCIGFAALAWQIHKAHVADQRDRERRAAKEAEWRTQLTGKVDALKDAVETQREALEKHEANCTTRWRDHHAQHRDSETRLGKIEGRLDA